VMTRKSKIVSLLAVLAVGAVAFLLIDRAFNITGGHSREVQRLIARNVAARGGADAWRSVSTLRTEGEMDIGQGMHVPYVIEQKRDGRMCLEFEFDNEIATQCVNGNTGWKRLPYMGRSAPEAMSETELHEMAGLVNIDGLLFESEKRGYKVELIGKELVDGITTSKLEVTLPDGTQRWVYLDDVTSLEVKVEAIRKLRGQQRLVATTYSDWREFDGIRLPSRQFTSSEGDTETHFVTVSSVAVNRPIEDERFEMPSETIQTARAVQ